MVNADHVGVAYNARGRQSLAARYRHDGGDQAAPIRRRASSDLVS
ncbi:MAG: hypothetical protein WBG18_20915 [Xanthobacteraceae bacterium]